MAERLLGARNLLLRNRADREGAPDPEPVSGALSPRPAEGREHPEDVGAGVLPTARAAARPVVPGARAVSGHRLVAGGRGSVNRLPSVGNLGRPEARLQAPN